LQLTAEFVVSAAGAADFPKDGAPEVALVGRSNVGKSSLINALVRRTVARTSAAPGKTRLINYYRVRPAGGPALYLADLPGYGYARGGPGAREVFQRMAGEYFGERAGRQGATPPPSHRRRLAGALLLIDARHPALAQDADAHAWLTATALPVVVVATKVDKLTRAARGRAEQQWEHAYQGPVLPVSAVTGEGLKALWTLIARLTRTPAP
jgi:GTP-binding protein